MFTMKTSLHQCILFYSLHPWFLLKIYGFTWLIDFCTLKCFMKKFINFIIRWVHAWFLRLKFFSKWPQPTAISVFYMHPIEFIMAIIINIYIGYWVTGCHTAIFHAYLLVESIKGLMNHRLEIRRPVQGFTDQEFSPYIPDRSFKCQRVSLAETGLIKSFFSGYKFIDIPCLIGNEFHDTHHKLTNCNYGSYGYFDAIFGSHVLNKKKE